MKAVERDIGTINIVAGRLAMEVTEEGRVLVNLVKGAGDFVGAAGRCVCLARVICAT
jgi:hypothetical protein